MTENKFPEVHLARETICLNCRHAVRVVNRNVPHPERVLEWQDEHPERDATTDGPFRVLIDHGAYCTHPDLRGGKDQPARNIGNVVACSLFARGDR